MPWRLDRRSTTCPKGVSEGGFRYPLARLLVRTTRVTRYHACCAQLCGLVLYM